MDKKVKYFFTKVARFKKYRIFAPQFRKALPP